MNIKLSNMETLFRPDSIAVIGASDKSTKLGFHVMLSLTKGGFPGMIIPINPGSTEIMGLRTMPSISDVPGKIDLAIVVLPAALVPAIFEECLAKGVKAIVLITAGFKEIDDPHGGELHEQLAGIMDKTPVPVIGPNTFGMINLRASLNASFTPEFSLMRNGVIGLVSQSGGMCHLISFLALRDDIGFSKIVGIGNRLNVDFREMVEYLVQDTDTEVIALYMEGVDRPRELIETAKAHRGTKPIIAYKTGVGDIGNQASRSHTGSLAGNEEIYSGAFSQAGILGVDSVESLLDTAKAMAVAPPLRGAGVAILSSQAGPGLAGADICQRAGLRIEPFSGKTQREINAILPPLAMRINPVDMGPAWYNSEATVGILQAVLKDENVSGILLFMMFASANVDSIKALSFLLERRKQEKPIITCLSAPPGIWDEYIRRYEEAGILVNFPTPERAAGVMVNLNRYRDLVQ
ncbi:MAG TPA: CoA-binding protein [Desulfatiglandales bacterium]|nr:CoA-binding protein [Desulfatiglandales bacterium]